MIFKVAICDDDKKDIQTIKQFLNTYEINYDIDFEISVFTDSRILLHTYNTSGKFHILFLDVEMPGMNGLELAKSIRNIPDKLVKIIFVSNYPEYMQDSFNVQAFQYFPKPLQYEKFQELMQRIITDYKESAVTKLLIKEDGAEELVYIEDIISIESTNSKKKQLCITLKDKKVTVQGILSDWNNMLGEYSFLSPCRGFLINLNHIHYIKEDDLIMSNNESIPMSRRQEKEIRKQFSKQLLNINQKR